MKKLILFTLLLIIVQSEIFSQGEYYNWYFGKNAGISFSPDGKDPYAITNSAMDTREGCAVISDSLGNLLFYTNGVKIWNRQHDIMLNCTELHGSHSSTQSAIIVQSPGDNNIYYIFTVPATQDSIRFTALKYSKVDITGDGGLGEVISENEYLFSKVTEKMTAVKHANGSDYWIIVHEWMTDAYVSFLLTEEGINKNPVISKTGTINSGHRWNKIGTMKVSPNCRKLASLMYHSTSIDLLDFDNETGILSNPVIIKAPDSSLYGLEFSPNSELLYVGNYEDGYIYQFNLKAGSPDLIANSLHSIETKSISGQLQLGPDDKIYYSRSGMGYLSVIHDPNIIGENCNYDVFGVDLEYGSCKLGLPPAVYICSDTEDNIDIEKDLIAYWCFEDSTLNVVSDESGNGHDGIVRGDPVFEPGKAGNGIRMDGDDWIEIENTAPLRPDMITISGWFKTNSDKGGNENQLMIIRNRHYGYKLNLNGQDGMLRCNISLKRNISLSTGPIGYDLNDGKWHHVAFTYDKYVLKIYLDSELVISETAPKKNMPIYYQPTGLSIGRNGDHNSDYFIGTMDEIRLYGRALNNKEIKTLYELGNEASVSGLPDELYFGVVCKGDSTIQVSLKNENSYSIFLSYSDLYKGIDFSHDAGEIYEILPREEKMINITFSPTENKTISDRLTLLFGTPNCTNLLKEITLIGDAYNPDVKIKCTTNKTCEGDTLTLSTEEEYASYEWSTGETESSIKITESGIYYVNIIADNGCPGSDTLNITFLPLPDIDIEIHGNSILCEGDSCELKAFPHIQGNRYLWSTGATSQSIIVKKEGTFTVTVENANGCKNTADSVCIEYGNDLLNATGIDGEKDLVFDTTHLYDLSTQILMIYNKGKKEIVLNNIILFHNLNFSIPPGQFPLVIPAEGSVELKICFYPSKTGVQRDTLIISDICSDKFIALSGTGKGLTYYGEAKCDTKVQIKIDSLKNKKIIMSLYCPNPISQSSIIDYHISDDTKVNLEVYNMMGEKVDILVNEHREAGNHEVWLNTINLPEGMYFLKLTAGKGRLTEKIILIR